jgi:hypothetical protein
MLDLDDLRELKNYFATELRRKNRSKSTIDICLVHIGYFVDYLLANDLPTIAPEVTRDHLGSYMEFLLTRPNRRTGRPCRPSTREISTGVCSSSSNISWPRKSSPRIPSAR